MIENIKWNEEGLAPAIAQDINTGAVVMMAWMNEQSLKQTIETGYATYYSRSREKLWKKGETSGHLQRVRGIYLDCDGDAILLKVDQTGAACHTGEYTCFFNELWKAPEDKTTSQGSRIVSLVADTVRDRYHHPVEGSYTNYLFEKGIDKILKKIGEESAEVIIAAKNNAPDEIRLEVADLIYHLTVMLTERGMGWEDVYAELESRYK
ncbi:MAG: bifunctional phosphoribosyl-AMP cyclohydrolase/phosphoribosyl-ATP diphosphatase HisIE [Christensenellales bacterium]|jgi:phosphoribosyl-ATP pyrophosphohydrolase/phosphoribosyl-AMP cyclohydrolase